MIRIKRKNSRGSNPGLSTNLSNYRQTYQPYHGDCRIIAQNRQIVAAVKPLEDRLRKIAAEK